MYDANDIESAALCCWKESRGETAEGMRAVLHCMVNRVGAPGFARTLHEIIYGKNQFTSMSVPSDPEFNLQPPSSSASSTDALMWHIALDLAPKVLNGGDPDVILAAVWYADEVEVTSGWYKRNIMDQPELHPVTVKIGRHTFRK